VSNIIHHIAWDSEGLSIDGQAVTIDGLAGSISSDMKVVYNHLNIDYAKFFKMDNLCKLGFLGVELLKTKTELSLYGDDEVALHFQNASSSLDTDAKHQRKINDGVPSSPAIFVYTLPNILIGEIAIRNKWFGENLFILSDKFDLEAWQRTNEVLFETQKAKAVIGGWVEVFEQDFRLELYFESSYKIDVDEE